MNRYLRMGTRRSGVPRPKPQGLDDGDTTLIREDSSAIDSVYDEIERDVGESDGLLDEEEQEGGGGSSPPALSRAWCGERGAYVAVRSPKGLVNRR